MGKSIWGPPATTSRWRTKSPWQEIKKWDVAAGKAGIRQRVFCQSMSDFFEDHPEVTTWRREAAAILESLEHLDIQLLTKRPENIPVMVPQWMADSSWPAHIWVGVSIGQQGSADHMLRHLAQVPALTRFVSAEPLIGRLELDMSGIDWLIIGGESGPKARPMELEWVYDLLRQASEAGVDAFVKQLGAVWSRSQKQAGAKGENVATWPAELRVREIPAFPPK